MECSIYDFSESELEDETDNIQMKFNALVTNVRLDMQKQSLSPQDVAQHLKHFAALESVYANADIPLLSERVEEIRFKPTLIAVFDVLSDYYSWFNHRLIVNIIEAFCSETFNVEKHLQKHSLNIVNGECLNVMLNMALAEKQT